MKYIRTENHIYLIQKDISYGRNRIYKIYNHDFSIIGNDFKVADTIEELCDLFIDEETKTIFHKHNGYVINWKTNMVYSLKALSESYHSVKGAIYTDEGLIYVAKMNESGDLELI